MYRSGHAVSLDDLEGLLEYPRRYENYIVSRCPFHSDNRPSFFVYEDYYVCLSCEARGSNLSVLLDKLSGLPSAYIPPLRFYNPWTRWLKGCTLGKVLRQSHLILCDAPSSYLRYRGISPEIQKELHLGKREDWITFPIVSSEKKIAGAVARAGEDNDSEAKYIIPKGQNPNLLYVPSWKRIRNAKHVFLTFGIIDAISLHVCGHAAMSTTTGKRLDPRSLDDVRKVIYIFPDRGEEREGMQLASKLGWRGKVIHYDYPEETKDPNDLLNVGVLNAVAGCL
jgi:DNA primase